MTAPHPQLENIPPSAPGCVLVIGNFDGVHLGHRALIEQARRIAEEEKTPLGVVTFEPHPRQFFQPEAEPFRLTLPPMKRRLLEGLGVAHVFSLAFDRALSLLGGEEFIDRILARQLRARHVVVGANFAFGRNRSGTVQTLKDSGKFRVSVVEPVLSPDGQRYSSTRIRNLLHEGRFQEAERLLGWPWAVEAPVVHGDRRGRALGFPTANQDVSQYARIPYGIYAARVKIEDETIWREGAASFGIRPMFQVAQPILETFIFDFSREIYGKNMCVQPVRRLRPEMAFQDVTALIAQMKEDCITAKAVLKSPQTL